MQEWLATQFACAVRTWLNSGSDPSARSRAFHKVVGITDERERQTRLPPPRLLKAILVNRSESGKCFSPMNRDLVSVWITDGCHVASWHVHWADDNRNVVLAESRNR